MLGQESRHHLAGCLWVTLSHKTSISVVTEGEGGMGIIVLKRGGAASKLTQVSGLRWLLIRVLSYITTWISQ